jgi:hypothetical protein
LIVLIFERDALELDAATTRRRDDATRDDDDATTTIATDRIDRASRGVARAASNARLPSIDSMPARRGDRPNATDDAIDIDGAFDRRRNRNRPRAPRSIGAIEPRRVDRTIVESRDRPGDRRRRRRHDRRHSATDDAMSDWADDSGDLPPLSAGLPPPPTTTTTTTIPKPSTSVPAPQVASPQKSGYVPPHLRNRQAAAGDGGSRGFGASTTTARRARTTATATTRGNF